MAILLTCQAKSICQNQDNNEPFEEWFLCQSFELCTSLYQPCRFPIAEAFSFLLLGALPTPRFPIDLGLANLFFFLFLIFFIFVRLLLHLLFQFKLFFSFSYSVGFFIEFLIQICSLYSNHQVENNKGTQNDNKNKEGIISFRPLGITYYIHHMCPILKSNYLEDVQYGHKDVIELIGVLYWVPELLTLHLSVRCQTWDISLLFCAVTLLYTNDFNFIRA